MYLNLYLYIYIYIYIYKYIYNNVEMTIINMNIIVLYNEIYIY